ncbi:hypothetical protein BKI52_08310 [marine bacterium AO1-C]|nr:hypothetical protein BKI52_08310 [marine bacterium AO1-C]
MKRAVKILIVSSFTIPLGFVPLLFMYGWDLYLEVLLSMSFAAFIPTAFVLYMFETVVCMSGLKKGEYHLARQMLLAVGFVALLLLILWGSKTRIKIDEVALEYSGYIFVFSFMLFGAVVNNVLDTRLR